MARKLWRENYGAKGMHAFIDYHRSGMQPSNVEPLWSDAKECEGSQGHISVT